MPATATDAREVKGSIARVAFHANGFLIARLDGGETVKGQMLEVQDGVAYTFRGRWDDDPKWGRQFRFESYETELPRDMVAISGPTHLAFCWR